jgi:hypothetical protein
VLAPLDIAISRVPPSEDKLFGVMSGVTSPLVAGELGGEFNDHWYSGVASALALELIEATAATAQAANSIFPRPMVLQKEASQSAMPWKVHHPAKVTTRFCVNPGMPIRQRAEFGNFD